MRKRLAILSMFLPLCVAGCGNDTTAPRFAGRIVSHVDSYQSGTGGSSPLSATGQMRTGFDYTEQSKADTIAEIKWAFLRRDGSADVYQIEWTFVDGNQRPAPNQAELAFDGQSPAKLPITDQLILSIEPMPSHEEASRPAHGSGGPSRSNNESESPSPRDR